MPAHHRLPRKRKQSGAFAAMFGVLLLVLIGFCGLALDLGMLYNRKAELHGIARSVALAAARELNGTAAGVDAALVKAGEAAARMKFQYGVAFTWSNAAISFSNTPSAGAEWVGADAARATPDRRYYVRVNTSALEDNIGRVDTLLMQVLSSAHASVSLSDVAIAGRATINVLPLAVCAMSPDRGVARTNPGPPATVELVEHGFRRGVGYDLMQLNPNGTTPISFVIDPLAPPGGLGSASNMSASAVSPFVCTGRMWIPRVTGGSIRVTSPFPIGSLYRQLNSRFDQYSGSVCNPNGAPPDFNIKQYAYDQTNGLPWMNPKPTRDSALPTVDSGRLRTVADLAAPPSGTAAGSYGPLWSYARPMKFAAYVPGGAEPTAASAKFAPADWPSLYPTLPPPAVSGYPATTPYQTSIGNNYSAPSAAHLAQSAMNRRVLHVPLLACPVAPGANVGASALAIGKFFMTVPATSTSIHAEFAGIVSENALTGEVILYP